MQKPPQHEINPKTNTEFGPGMGASTGEEKLLDHWYTRWGQVRMSHGVFPHLDWEPPKRNSRHFLEG